MTACDAQYFYDTSKCVKVKGHDGAHMGISKSADGRAVLLTWMLLSDVIEIPDPE